VSGNVRIGQCKLTGTHGRYVDAHIIPEALTETVWKGKPLTQNGRHGRRIKRWTSWYDSRLVTAEGEDILARYDDWAIKFFRQKKLIWSSWGPMEQLDLPDHSWGPGRWGYRKLDGVDCARLRLFFLSLLWRAAATSLFEFDLVALPANELAQLRDMVLYGQVEPYHFYPIMLAQLSTRNFPHNRAVGRLIKRQLVPDTITGNLVEDFWREIHHYRFFFDGLIAHMHINDDAEHVARSESVFVGPGNELLIPTVSSEESIEMELFWRRDVGEQPPPPFLTRRSHLF
jgi:hypothetical protein